MSHNLPANIFIVKCASLHLYNWSKVFVSCKLMMANVYVFVCVCSILFPSLRTFSKSDILGVSEEKNKIIPLSFNK